MAPVRIRIKKRTIPSNSKPRKWNWDSEETISLLNAYESEKQELTDGSNKWRRSIWKRIANRIYPTDSPFRRTPVEVQKKWRNLCATVRQEVNKSVRKKSSKAESNLSPILRRVAEIIAANESTLKGVAKAEITSSKRKTSNGTVAKDAEPNLSSPTPSTSSSTMTDSSSFADMDPQRLCLSNAISTAETILPTLPQSSSTREKRPPILSIMKDVPIPFIKEEPLSPVPEKSESLQVQKEAETVSKTRSAAVAKTPTPIFTFATPTTSTNANSGPSPLRIISIVNPISSASSRTSTSNTPPKLILKPINGLTNLTKSSTSNIVVVNPRPPPNAAPVKKTQPQPQIILQPRTSEASGPRDTDSLQLAAVRLSVEHERLQVEKETLEVERKKVDLEKQKLEQAKEHFQLENARKRVLLEDRKLQLENKKLKSEIGKLALEKELLSLQIKKLQD